MIKRSVSTVACVIGLLSFVACKNGGKNEAEEYENKVSDSANVAAIMYGHDAKDTSVIAAYLEDKSIISINDIDPKDTSYSTRTKVLYKPGADGKSLAVVYGFKNGDKKGMAVMQRPGEKPLTLKETQKDGDVRTYSNGTITLQKAGAFAFVDGVQYEEIR